MLLELRVKDLGIIEDINWKLHNGLNVITGETGAGKSLVIDAVELLLIGSASEDIIRHGATEARIEGVFVLSDDKRFSPLKTALLEKGIYDEDTLVINCDIRKQKPGIVRINGHTVTKTILRQIGQLLIDIHGQSEHLSLLDKKYHLDFLDAYAHVLDLRNEFSSKVTQLHTLETEIKEIETKAQDRARQEEFLKYQIDEIKKAKLREGEDEALEKERHIISFSEKIKEYSAKVCESLYDGESSRFAASALTKLTEAVQAMKKLAELDASLNPQLDLLDKTIYSVEEIARDVRTYNEKLEHDPARLEEIESRLELIRNLKRKYGKTISEIMAYLEKSEKELDGFNLSSERRTQLEQEQRTLKNELGRLATELSNHRSQAAQDLEKRVKKELQDLDMSEMQFSVSIWQESSIDGISGPDGKTCLFSNDGIDNIEFMVSTNPGEPLRSLAKIASTGEISRFTLALKGALSEADNIPVLIFDEVDIGIGGRSGDTIGKKLWALARNHQVICVTHLPQIAAYADAHFCVHKETSGDRTTSILENLDKTARLNEIAAMLGGPKFTEITHKNALELLHKAEKWKKGA